MNELIRCRDCGRPISRDQQQNFLSLCYECFRRLKSSQMGKGFAMLLIGSISLPFVILYISVFSTGFLFEIMILRRKIIFIIGSIVAVAIPSLLIFFGVKRKRKWKISWGEKPIIEKQKIITINYTSKDPTHIKYCPECGSKIVNINQKFCMNCGTET